MLPELIRWILQLFLRAWRIDGLALLEPRVRSFFLLCRVRPLERALTLSKPCKMAPLFRTPSLQKYISSATWLLRVGVLEVRAHRKLELASGAEEEIGLDFIWTV